MPGAVIVSLSEKHPTPLINPFSDFSKIEKNTVQLTAALEKESPGIRLPGGQGAGGGEVSMLGVGSGGKEQAHCDADGLVNRTGYLKKSDHMQNKSNYVCSCWWRWWGEGRCSVQLGPHNR